MDRGEVRPSGRFSPYQANHPNGRRKRVEGL